MDKSGHNGSRGFYKKISGVITCSRCPSGYIHEVLGGHIHSHKKKEYKDPPEIFYLNYVS